MPVIGECEFIGNTEVGPEMELFLNSHLRHLKSLNQGGLHVFHLEGGGEIDPAIFFNVFQSPKNFKNKRLLL